MRDTAILLLLCGALVWSLRQPWIGVMGWTLVSLGSPHVQFGYAAAAWPVGLGFALCTLIGMLLSKDQQNPLAENGSRWLLAFVIWTCVTLPFSAFFEPSFDLWLRSIKIFLMLFVTLALLTDRHKLDVFIWVSVAAVSFYGIKGGAFTILTGGNYRVWGPGGFIGGNNEVALAVLTVLPLMRYLQMQMRHKLHRLMMSVAMALCLATVVGTYSRGALVGLFAMGAVFWWKSRSKVGWAAVIVLVVLVGLPLMPEQWWARMNTIETYGVDQSALGRINAWWMAWNLATDRFFGGGFMVSMPELFARYAPDPYAIHAAHSIYFQVLGEHGFVGLFLFLALGVATWRAAAGLRKLARAAPHVSWAGDLGSMVQVSMVAYGAAGAFLSLAYYDLPYNIMIITMLGLRFAKEQAAAPVRRATNAAVVQARDPPRLVARLS